MAMPPVETPVVAETPPPPPATSGVSSDQAIADGAIADSRLSAAESLAAQAELVDINRLYMIAMAWYSFALAVSSKIAGR